jgi:hypothetical protein
MATANLPVIESQWTVYALNDGVTSSLDRDDALRREVQNATHALVAVLRSVVADDLNSDAECAKLRALIEAIQEWRANHG